MKKNLFGTDGIRTTVGDHPLTLQLLPQLGHAIAQWALQKYNKKPSILLGHDTRESCALIKAGLKTGLLQNNVDVTDAYVVPTPVLCQLVQKQDRFDCGIIISASHNPYHDNGLKIIDASNGKLSEQDEHTITELFYTHTATPTYQKLGTDTLLQNVNELYYQEIQTHFDAHFLAGVTVVLDYAHGATYQLAPQIFKQCGAQVISINNTPDGKNINDNCGALHLDQLQKKVIEHKADIGFAFDGDGDRVMAVSKDGVIKNGDDILALLLQHNTYQQQTGIVGTIMSNQGLHVHLTKNNKTLVRTPVGDKYVAQQLLKDNLLLGGEQSGHIIIRDYLTTGDGIFTALKTVESVMQNNNWDLHTFERYPQVLINVPVKEKKDLTQKPFATLITNREQQLKSGRLVVRYSGTEKLLRIMVEDDDAHHAHAIGTQLSQELQHHLAR